MKQGGKLVACLPLETALVYKASPSPGLAVSGLPGLGVDTSPPWLPTAFTLSLGAPREAAPWLWPLEQPCLT